LFNDILINLFQFDKIENIKPNQIKTLKKMNLDSCLMKKFSELYKTSKLDHRFILCVSLISSKTTCLKA
jgi:hypothetical protein